jgi:hypothetical protein
MNDLSLINPDTGLNEREEAFLDVLFDECNGNVRAAMDAVGYPKSFPMNSVTKKLAKHIKERTKEYLQASSGFAAIQLVNVLMDPNKPGTNNLIAAARDVLDRGGVFKEEAPQVTEIRNMFILPAKDEEPLTIDHED